jgi:hypothetical protein
MARDNGWPQGFAEEAKEMTQKERPGNDQVNENEMDWSHSHPARK